MLIDKMRDAFGYDSFGNSWELLAQADRIKINNGIPRAGGGVICEHCGVAYYRHPPVQGALWATRTCRAGIVKL